jgi:O-antigen/teichoic acid export membrane protein
VPGHRILGRDGFFILIPFFGVFGAVAATTISFVFMAIMLRAASKGLTDIDGSVLRLQARLVGRQVSLPAE